MRPRPGLVCGGAPGINTFSSNAGDPLPETAESIATRPVDATQVRDPTTIQFTPSASNGATAGGVGWADVPWTSLIRLRTSSLRANLCGVDLLC